jgi:two-component system OmpR family response regulator
MRVLLVEDDPGMVYFLEKTLVKQEHTVVSVNNGRFASKVCKEEHFDLVVLEEELARENGFEVCRMMRRQQISTPILLMTRDSLPGSLAKIVEVGANGHLAKPFSTEELGQKLRKIQKMKTVPFLNPEPSGFRRAAV